MAGRSRALGPGVARHARQPDLTRGQPVGLGGVDRVPPAGDGPSADSDGLVDGGLRIEPVPRLGVGHQVGRAVAEGRHVAVGQDRRAVVVGQHSGRPGRRPPPGRPGASAPVRRCRSRPRRRPRWRRRAIFRIVRTKRHTARRGIPDGPRRTPRPPWARRRPGDSWGCCAHFLADEAAKLSRAKASASARSSIRSLRVAALRVLISSTISPP